MMRGSYKQTSTVSGVTRFDKAPEGRAERSRMTDVTRVMTAFNAGDIVPVKCIEVVPSEVYSVTVDSIIRQTTLLTPTMGEMICDVYAYFVPNRIVNKSWKNVMGENSSGAWTANPVSLAPLYNTAGSVTGTVQIPVGSVADYYGLATQQPYPAAVLNLMHDLPFRGYLAIYNEYFRDENYQPPIPFSTANVYEGFLQAKGSTVSVTNSSANFTQVTQSKPEPVVSDGSFPGGSLLKEVYGEGFSASSMSLGSSLTVPARKTSWSALDPPLKANKLHDALTSVLPSPQRGPQVMFSIGESADVEIPAQSVSLSGSGSDGVGLTLLSAQPNETNLFYGTRNSSSDKGNLAAGSVSVVSLNGLLTSLQGTADLSSAVGLSVDDLRMGLAMQQLYEVYGRSGGRYREICHALFGIDVDDPFSDIPRMLGHVRFPLQLFQTAQTSASEEGSPQGSLAGFGYTDKGGFLFHETFLEHGYIHILCTVRQRNIYPAYTEPHWFRLNQLDFYDPILANISEQPVMLRTINPFGTNPNSTVFGYQEAWWEYRQHPDTVTGIMRSGAKDNVSVWTYQDVFDASQSSADASFMESNAQEVLDVTLAVESSNGPQFKALFTFTLDHEFPGPVYSVPGLDVV